MTAEVDGLSTASLGLSVQDAANFLLETISRLQHELQEQQRVVEGLRKDAEFVCGCEWNDAGELEAACMKHWQYFWKLHGPHCQTPTPKNFTAGTDPAKWNISGMSAIDAAIKEK